MSRKVGQAGALAQLSVIRSLECGWRTWFLQLCCGGNHVPQPVHVVAQFFIDAHSALLPSHETTETLTFTRGRLLHASLATKSTSQEKSSIDDLYLHHEHSVSTPLKLTTKTDISQSVPPSSIFVIVRTHVFTEFAKHTCSIP